MVKDNAVAEHHQRTSDKKRFLYRDLFFVEKGECMQYSETKKILRQSADLYNENINNKEIVFVYLKANKAHYVNMVAKTVNFKYLTGINI